VAYLNLRSALDLVQTECEEDRMALNMLRRALEEPTRQITQNAGLDGAVIVEEIKRRQQASANPMIGFDVMRAESGDLGKWGVIDPAKVVRAALENAVSVAGMILSTDTLIADVPEPQANEAPVPVMDY
jgi:chaperonin GroEL